MSEITIKKFCEEYNKLATDSMKDIYLRDNLDITPYVPFTRKLTVADKLVRVTMHDDTGNIRVNSAHTYLFFIKAVLDEYTNLLSESPSFADEYDELKKAGILNKLIVGDKERNIKSLIDSGDLDEFKSIVDMRKNDLLTNKYEPHAYISDQIDRLKSLGEATLMPLVDVVKVKLDSLSKEDLGKLVEFIKEADFKEV